MLVSIDIYVRVSIADVELSEVALVLSAEFKYGWTLLLNLGGCNYRNL